jgi:glycosyltransferase involved in cell wall biosynthesis
MSLALLLKGQVPFFQQQNFEVFTASADGPEVAGIKAQDIPHAIVPLTRTISPWKDLVCIWQLIQLIRKIKPDIVHTHTPKAGLLGMLAAWICGVPVRMHTVAGLPLMEARGIKRFVLNVTEQITYFCAQHVYPNSVGLRDFIQREFWMGRNKLKMIGRGSSNGIDTNYFKRQLFLEEEVKRIRQHWNIETTEVVFGFVGRLVKDKGLVEFIQAFQQLNNVRARLLLVGSFEEALDPLPKNCLDFLEKDPGVILPGFQHDVRPWMMAMDVFVFPSYREGFPNVIMQAACLEVPCIVSDINGCNELITDGVTGWVIPVKNSARLADAMSEAMANETDAKNKAKAARTFVVENFSADYVWNELLKEYKSLLNS